MRSEFLEDLWITDSEGVKNDTIKISMKSTYFLPGDDGE
jgi:hypothetical protein